MGPGGCYGNWRYPAVGSRAVLQKKWRYARHVPETRRRRLFLRLHGRDDGDLRDPPIPSDLYAVSTVDAGRLEAGCARLVPDPVVRVCACGVSDRTWIWGLCRRELIGPIQGA